MWQSLSLSALKDSVSTLVQELNEIDSEEPKSPQHPHNDATDTWDDFTADVITTPTQPKNIPNYEDSQLNSLQNQLLLQQEANEQLKTTFQRLFSEQEVLSPSLL